MYTLIKISEKGTIVFPFAVIGAAVAAYFFPQFFAPLASYIGIMLGIVMFGMGMTIDVTDIVATARCPGSILAGLIAQYAIMGPVALGICKLLGLNPELAIGVILVGTCPGGTASNVMTYIAKGDVAFSVTLTAISTLLAPLLTPYLTLWLGGTMVEVNAGALMWGIAKIVLLPVVAGIILRICFPNAVERATPVLPIVSSAAIIVIVAIVVALQGENLRTMGKWLMLTVFLHNTIGLVLGYWIGWVMGMEPARRKALAIEVGMQNSGLAVALAKFNFSTYAALPGAIFSIWQNISGPMLAMWFASREYKDQE